MESLGTGARLRVAGSAFVVFGRVAPQRPGGKPGAAIAGPTILPALPAIYVAQTAIKVRYIHLHSMYVVFIFYIQERRWHNNMPCFLAWGFQGEV